MAKRKEKIEEERAAQIGFLSKWSDFLSDTPENLAAKIPPKPFWAARAEQDELPQFNHLEAEQNAINYLDSTKEDRQKALYAPIKKLTSQRREQRRSIKKLKSALGLHEPKEPSKPITPEERALVEQEFDIFGRIRPETRARDVLDYLNLNNPLPPVTDGKKK